MCGEWLKPSSPNIGPQNNIDWSQLISNSCLNIRNNNKGLILKNTNLKRVYVLYLIK